MEPANPSELQNFAPVTFTEQPLPAATGHDQPNPLDVSGSMVAFTWLTFGLLALVLYKVAWKPILNALDQRENQIKTALEEAEKTRAEYAKIEEERQRLIQQADEKARQIVDQARHAAIESAQVIEAKARDEAGILLANAQREIRSEHDRVIADLRRESAELAISLARKILADQMDEARSRSLLERLQEKV
ncbi:MAG: F0F1 ATP synthase subunit B [Kiritimatiellae bacterium]|nr:F0F1 ATP synthase subunit B [Kiritimatiellia bacterium]MCO5060791.1 F0F1 ATP synthase subunit B [Kiritimatiellia bacterium]MCO6399850.1 F0F1 ATP synthase subunit B [Verrucomicrobiota bacterium]